MIVVLIKVLFSTLLLNRVPTIYRRASNFAFQRAHDPRDPPESASYGIPILKSIAYPVPFEFETIIIPGEIYGANFPNY